MGNRLTILMTIAVLCSFAVILLMNVAALFGYIPSKYISQNDVRGIAIEHNHLLYTLNFDQQKALVDIFNRAVPVTKDSIEARKTTLPNAPDIQKIVIYRFDAPDIEITPVAYVNKTTSVQSSNHTHASLVFSAPLWNAKGYLEEAASDEFHQLLSNTYDP